jgi:DNA repair exonuclease SbcCD ATPase subunit
MQISKIKISNILGIDELEIEPGKFTEISGRNGSGKTSILEAIKSALKGGNDATLLRNGAKSGEVVLILDEGMQLVKRVTGSKNDLTIYDDKGNEIKKPQSVINDLIDMLSINPVSFLTADKKSRTNALLEVLPLVTPTEDLQKILSDVNLQANFNGHALEAIASVHKVIYDERTALNRMSKEKLASINQLSETLVEPDYSPEAIEKRIEELETKRVENTTKKDVFLHQVLKIKDEKLEKARIEYEAIRKAINDESDAQQLELNTKFEASYNPIIEELTKLREQQKQSGAVLKTKELIRQYSDETDKLTNDAEKLTDGITRIEELKSGLLANLPIEGLEIVDGEILRHGVFFDRLNTAQQTQLAVEVAKLRTGKLGIVCLDGLEKLDAESFKHLEENLSTAGLQSFISRVTDTDLTIETK